MRAGRVPGRGKMEDAKAAIFKLNRAAAGYKQEEERR